MQSVKLVTLAAIAALGLPVAAQTESTPGIHKRQDRHERRIDKGVKSGQLTKREDKAVADGSVTKKEKARIEKAQDHQSKKIYREKHDKQTAK